jgi:phage baseplate assembly protein W
MPDLEMSWSGDLSVSATGDLAIVADPSLGTERVLRRLLTNPGDYIWNPDYGAGLGQFVGRPVDLAGVEALIRAQMALESAVSSTPEPIISISSDVAGRLYLQIRYEDSITAISSALTASVPG